MLHLAISRAAWHTVVVIFALCMPLGSLANSYPSKTIRLIVPFAQGGLSDVGGRIVADSLSRELGTSVIVDNRPGAGGNIGAQVVTTAPADGYTLLLGFEGTLVINPHVYAKVPFDPLKDFVAIGKIGDVNGVIVANPSLPVKTFQEMVVYSKSRPEGLSYGTSGIGGTSHVVAETIARRTGAMLVHVPYKGGTVAMTDVLGGAIPLNFTSVATAYPYIKDGRVRALAVTSSNRASVLPDVPTVGESGLPGFAQNTWIGLFTSAKTPAPVLERLRTAFAKVLAMPDLKARLLGVGLTTTSQTPEEFQVQLRKDYEFYKDAVKDAGIKIE
jgi:tripartite-type tricarboxylate transporter receptor subunit TctC